MNGQHRPLVLVVDDEFLIAQGLRLQVEDLDMEVCATAASADEAVALAVAYRPELVLMDMRLRGEKDGVDAALAIHDTVGSKVIFITGSREPATLARIQMDHPAGVLFKPISDRQLKSAIAVALGA
ncbi:response regulator containing CheY-like receiver domain and AraC-type DNA-binding domain [Caulobacter sp. AP07]|uniref:response regulator n=1 Tax=Caulobacter sp. AP07 TaxID=1144304 RepID=UPI00027206F6|nr:response regulator [Caulobacter sp. AP07]EJL32063.1 response regulator containing CheY-like receiver domain and AraC-type DNA-binding domain [Caulobacter sp. AP07]